MRQSYTYRQLHKKYGSVMRIGPNSVNVSDPQLITQMYGHKHDFIKVIKCHGSTYECASSTYV